ncbi:MAG: MFS transporter [Streptosporangiaceae bacterium]
MRYEWLHRRAGVLRERNFRRFYAGYVTSLLGSSMSSVAIAWAVLESGKGATGLGFVFTAGVVSQVVMLPLAGAVADRLGRRRVMLSADVLRCAAQAGLAAALFTGRPPLWLFVLLAWLEGTGEAFFSPALGALTVEIAPPGQLANANALYGLAASAARIAGPALGGILVALAGPAVVVATDAASFGASVLALGLLRMPEVAGTARAGRQGRRGLLGDMAEGWGEFRSRTWLWVVTVQFAFFNLITWAPWMLLGPVMGRAYLGGAAVWGAIMAVQGAGAIAAGLGSLGRKPRRPMVIATVGTFCYALPDIPMALHATAPWVAAAAFACGAGAALSSTFFGTALQQQVPPAMLARVSSLTLFPAYGVGVIGYAIDGPLAGRFGASAVFGVGAVYGLLSSAAVLAFPAVRALRWTESLGSAFPGGRPEGGEGAQPHGDRDHDRDGEHLSDVHGRGEGDEAERRRDPARGQGERRRDPARGQGERCRDPGDAQDPVRHEPRLSRQPQHHPAQRAGGQGAEHAKADRERQPVQAGDRGDPDQDQCEQREYVDRPRYRAQDHDVDVPAVDVLVGRGAGRADEVPDRARRVAPPEPDPA